MFLPRLPHADVKLLLFAPDAARSSLRETNTTSNTNKTNQKKAKEQGKKKNTYIYIYINYYL